MCVASTLRMSEWLLLNVQKSLKTPKGQSEAVNRWIDNTMAK